MKVDLWLFVVLISFEGFVQGYEDDSNRNIANIQRIGNLQQNWQKRSISRRVNLMLKILMKGTKEVPTQSPYYVKYAKEGTKDDALADFISLKLDGIRRSKTNSQDPTTDGNIGPVLVRLNTSDRHQYDKPSISVQNKKKLDKF